MCLNERAHRTGNPYKSGSWANKCSRNPVVLHQQNQPQLSKIKIRHLLNIIFEQGKKIKKYRSIAGTKARHSETFSLCKKDDHHESEPLSSHRIWNPNRREREGEGRRGEKKKSSHSARHNLKDFALKIQLVVNISPHRITLKPPHSCFCTTVPTVSQRCFATKRRRNLSGSLEIPML